MKKKVILVGALILSVLSLAEERVVNILAPGDLDVKDVKVMGIIKSGDDEKHIHYTQELDSSGEVKKDTDGNSIVDKSDEVNVEVSTDYTAYGGTQYIAIKITDIDQADEVKYIIGYESGEEEGLTRYTIIASSDIKDDTAIHNEFKSETNPIEGLEVLDFLMSSSSHNTYETFPGKELSEKESIISGFVVGDTISDDTTEPSNIEDIYYAEGDPGDNPINVVEGGASINPTGSGENNEFRVWAVKTNSDGEYLDAAGKIVTDREDAERIMLFANKGNNEALYTDFSEFTGNNKPTDGTFYADGEPRPSYAAKDNQSYQYGYYDNYVFDIAVRFQGDKVPKVDENGDIVYDDKGKMVMISPSLIVNGVDVIAKGGSKEYVWNFNNTSDVTLDYIGGQFLFNLGGDSIIIEPEPGQDIPNPIAQKIYVMDDEGKFLEGEAAMRSEYEDTVKYRTSNIKMKVMTKNGETEEYYEVTSIEE